MDDSDRSRDEPSAPEDDSVADDGRVDSADSPEDGSAEESDETPGDGRVGDEEGGESAGVEPEVSPEVTSEIGTDEDSAGDEDGDDTFDAHEPGSAKHLDDSRKPDLGSDSDDDADDADGDDTDADDANALTVEDGGIASGGSVESEEEFSGIEAPETDEEMPLAAHIEEMMRRLAVVFVFGGLATLVVVTESTDLINYFWSYHIPAPMENRPRLYGPLELPLTRLKVAGLAGVVVGLPAFVYQTYRFMKPGLYENERRYYLAAVPTSLVLGGVGIAFAHFLVLPAIFSYFTTYTSDAATIAFGLAETFNLIVIMLAFMAIVFQIPLFIMLAIMMNLVTRQWLEAKRLIFWGSFLGIAFLFSPDPTGMAPIIVTLTMIILYEGTLAVLRWTGN
ncbi:MFS transporter [Halorubrum persicum]|uniref:Sec-independent protein translocase protein TatC n=1 Tax=Halorubrum persicum TaxID=1383844 RepID=A0A2G1WEE7_9EURY|nr:twin-arginine translocase subunit TatC [Halorubrum persicum]PHQ37365.1 MFS transporter [Halorubrum persicum]